MEERYRKMSKIGVRNVASYNETNNEAGSAHKGETYLYGATIRESANGNAS